MYNYKAYLINNKIKNTEDGKISEMLIGEWGEDLPIEKFMNSSDFIYCLTYATKPFIRNTIKKAPYLRTRIVPNYNNDYIWIDFGSHSEFIKIYCEFKGEMT